ncbi:hypothetical protein EWM64_g10662 [Hericium alpestre]|uniref:Uncharacterized protein n=1 Tax=Hericium alpestre TaxID=135208 RepID=A0A4Y9ZGP9_9AGAM|nr:hypothetical protein EWM64_g10662 [Hericium alpestre]
MSTHCGTSRGRANPYRGGRNAWELCECTECKQDTDPGQSGCWIPQWEVAKHRRNDAFCKTAYSDREKPHLMSAAPQRVSGGTRAEDDECDMRGEGSSKCARLMQSDEELDHSPTPATHPECVLSPLPHVNHTSPLDHVQSAHAPDCLAQEALLHDTSSDTPGPETHDLRDLYEDPDDLDECMMELLSHVEELVQDSDDSDDAEVPATGPVHQTVPDLEHLSESTFGLPLPPAPLPPDQILDDSHNLWFVQVILLVVAYLNTKFHLQFKACAVLLFALRQIFVALGLIEATDTMPETLKTTFKHLQLEDQFHLLITCPSCFRMFEPTVPSTSTCSTCNIPLFDTSHTSTTSDLFQRVTHKALPALKPKLSVPFQLLSSLLMDMLACLGMEEEMDAWKSRGQEDGKYKEIMDGAIWKTLKGHDKKIFFNAEDDSEELRIGVTLRLDWYAFVICL